MGLESRHNRNAEARMGWALSRAAVTAAVREVDPRDPTTWEFCGFSQNGEDGIIDYLTRRLLRPDRRFVEIGASYGLDNNTAWLAIGRRYQGVMVEASPRRAARARATMSRHAQGVTVLDMRVDRDNASAVAGVVPDGTPDVFSLDIDGNDYHVLEAMLQAGFRPRIVVVEYNSTFGPERAVTIPYDPGFRVDRAHTSRLYYGASVRAWRRLLEPAGYRFVTVDANGINAFFADTDAFPEAFLRDLSSGPAFAENCTQHVRFREPWTAQFERIAHLSLDDVD